MAEPVNVTDPGAGSTQGAAGKWHWADVLLLAFTLVAITVLYWQLIDPTLAGFIHDDGVYLTSSKALAQGKGFTLLHVVGQPAQVKYPIIFPLLLSVGWLVNSNFPENLTLLTAIPMLFGVASLGLLFRYLIRFHNFPSWLAWLVVALMAGSFYFMFFATAVMSEMPYLFFTLLALWFLRDRLAHHPVLSTRAVLMLGLITIVTMHTRLTGIALAGAIGLWLAMRGQWKQTLVYGLMVVGLGLLPWMAWIHFQTMPLDDPYNYALRVGYSNYSDEFVYNIHDHKALMIKLEELLKSLGNRSFEALFPLLYNLDKIYVDLKPYLSTKLGQLQYGFGLVTGTAILLLYYGLQMAGTVRQAWRARKNGVTQAFGEAFSPDAMYVLFYLVVICIWNYTDQQARFLLSVTPFFWLYFYKPWVSALREAPLGLWPIPCLVLLAAMPAMSLQEQLQKLGIMLLLAVPFLIRAYQKTPALLGKVVFVLMMAVMVLWPSASVYRSIHRMHREHWIDYGTYKWLWDDYQSAFAYINHNLPETASLAAGSDAVFYLYTNRPTFYTFWASLRREKGKFTEGALDELMRSLQHYQIQYLVLEPHMESRLIKAPQNLVALGLLKSFPEHFKLVYTSPRQAIRIYEIREKRP